MGPDEPRYASIGREMARSGDWVTPRLWGEPWFEKPPLLYWMTASAYRLGLGDDLAPRLPVAILGALFLPFFYWSLKREFGARPAGYATAILGGCAGWIGYSHAAVPDAPMSIFFSAAMLLGMRWLRTGDRRWLTAAAASLGLAVLGKSLVPLALALPFAWHARARLRELLDWRPLLLFFAIAAPWHALCYLKNGAPFVQTLFLEHQFGRFTSPKLQHVRSLWFYLPVMAAALFPWTPALALLFRRSLYSDSRRVFLLLWLCFGMLMFSISVNKLPGYILPLLPAAAALLGIALSEARGARWVLANAAGLLCLVLPVASILPRALDAGLSRADAPAWNAAWALPLLLAAVVWILEQRRKRTAAIGAIAGGLIAGMIYLEVATVPAIDTAASARQLWGRIAARRDQVCVEEIRASWRYGLNYYSIDPLPDCAVTSRPVRVTQSDRGAVLTPGP